MAKIDKIKEFIGFLKMIFGILVAVDVSVIGWLFSQHTKAVPSNVVLAIVVIVVATVGIVVVNKKILEKIDELEEL